MRATFSAAGSLTSTSVRMVWPEAGASARRGAPPATGSTEIGAARALDHEQARAVEQQIASRAPELQRSRDPRHAGARRVDGVQVSPATVKIVLPSVLTTSGSSTPSSWTFVVE